MTKTIDFIADMTTLQAVKAIFKCLWVIVRNIGRAINALVHRLPWLCIILVVAASTVTSFVYIAKARAERDAYNKKMVHLQQRCDTLSNILEWKGGTK